VCSVPTEVLAAERARWLAQLSEALEEAHRLLIAADFEDEERCAMRELCWRIEAARFEVQSLRLSRSLNPREEKGPAWMQSLPWRPAGRGSI
jgi:hypothetical protein